MWAVHLGLILNEQKSRGNRSLEKTITKMKGKCTERCLSSENMVENKEKNQNTETRETKGSAYM